MTHQKDDGTVCIGQYSTGKYDGGLNTRMTVFWSSRLPSYTVETAYKVTICPTGNLLYT